MKSFVQEWIRIEMREDFRVIYGCLAETYRSLTDLFRLFQGVMYVPPYGFVMYGQVPCLGTSPGLKLHGEFLPHPNWTVFFWLPSHIFLVALKGKRKCRVPYSTNEEKKGHILCCERHSSQNWVLRDLCRHSPCSLPPVPQLSPFPLPTHLPRS